MKRQFLCLAFAFVTAAAASAQQAGTTTAIHADRNPSPLNTAVCFTVAVTSNQGIPTGTIAWNDGRGVHLYDLYGGSTYPFCMGGSFNAAYPYPFLPGQYTFTATYSGDTTSLPSSAVHVQTVRAVKRGDFDADGRADILLRDPLGNLGRWYMDGVDIVRGEPVLFQQTSVNAVGMTVSAAGNFNCDGLTDIVLVASSGYPYIHLFASLSWSPIPPCSFGGCIDPLQGVGDFDGDCHSDFLMRDASGNIRMWTFTTGGIGNRSLFTGNHVVGPLDPSYTIVGVDDFDGDGKADIAITDALGGIGVWTMDRERIATGGYSGMAGGSLQVVGTGDFDGDGRADILLRDDDGNVGIWFMFGATIVHGTLAGVLPDGYRIVAVNDYDGDGKSDILIRDASGDVGMWLMDGGVIREAAFVGTLGPGYDVW